MRRQNMFTCSAVFSSALALALGGTALARTPAQANPNVESGGKPLVRGGGTTIIEGGTGTPDFLPVLTTVAFHAERKGGAVTGGFECLALVPPSKTGEGSGGFTVNAMYVTGQVTSASLRGDTATLAGTANITGVGAGSNVPFTFEVKNGGPGATAILTTDGSTHLVFHEILVQGAFQVGSD